jgi:hypothetical protein
LKKETTGVPARAKQGRSTTTKKTTTKLTVGIDLGDQKSAYCMKSVGGRLPGASGHYFAKKVREHIPAAIRDALTPLLDQIEEVSTQIRGYDKRI